MQLWALCQQCSRIMMLNDDKRNCPDDGEGDNVISHTLSHVPEIFGELRSRHTHLTSHLIVKHAFQHCIHTRESVKLNRSNMFHWPDVRCRRWHAFGKHIWSLVSAWRKHFQMKLTFFNVVLGVHECVRCHLSDHFHLYCCLLHPRRSALFRFFVWLLFISPGAVVHLVRASCALSPPHNGLHLINHINYNYPKNLGAFLAELTGERKRVLYSSFEFSAGLGSVLFTSRPPTSHHHHSAPHPAPLGIQKAKIIYSLYFLVCFVNGFDIKSIYKLEIKQRHQQLSEDGQPSRSRCKWHSTQIEK